MNVNVLYDYIYENISDFEWNNFYNTQVIDGCVEGHVYLKIYSPKDKRYIPKDYERFVEYSWEKQLLALFYENGDVYGRKLKAQSGRFKEAVLEFLIYEYMFSIVSADTPSELYPVCMDLIRQLPLEKRSALIKGKHRYTAIYPAYQQTDVECLLVLSDDELMFTKDILSAIKAFLEEFCFIGLTLP